MEKLPRFYKTFHDCVASLGYADEPQYQVLEKIFSDALSSAGYALSFPFLSLSLSLSVLSRVRRTHFLARTGHGMPFSVLLVVKLASSYPLP